MEIKRILTEQLAKKRNLDYDVSIDLAKMIILKLECERGY